MPRAVTRFADATTMPWLGGGGITHELARHPADGDFGWRLSVAEVQLAGAFSRLDGVDRVIVLCSPGRMMLHTPDPVELQRFSPYAFDGGTDVSCTVPDNRRRHPRRRSNRQVELPEEPVRNERASRRVGTARVPCDIST